MKKKERIIGAGVLLFFVITISIFIRSLGSSEYLVQEKSEDIFKQESISVDEKQNEIKNNEIERNAQGYIIAEIKGEVKNPDVYKIKSESRINDLIILAGGLTEFANINSINRASAISDGECIIIRNINDDNNEDNETQIISNNGNVSNKQDTININRANLEELKNIPGIGDSKAQAIIDYRNDNGNFKSVDDLTNVTGIGAKTIDKIRDKIGI